MCGCKLSAVFIPEGYCWIVFFKYSICPQLLLSRSSFSFLYTVLSQHPVGTVSYPFSVCTAKCFYPLASGYAFLSLCSFPNSDSLTFLWFPFFRLFTHFTTSQTIQACQKKLQHWSENGTSPVIVPQWQRVSMPPIILCCSNMLHIFSVVCVVSKVLFHTGLLNFSKICPYVSGE